jgi:GNAT superfamily N-acetyltransferase
MARLAGGACQEESGLLVYHAGVPDPVVWNGAIVTAPTALGPEELVQQADSFFASRTDSYGFWSVGSRDEDLARFLTAGGTEEIDNSPHMVAECSAVQRPASSVSVEIVTDDAGRRAFVDVSTAAFETIGADPRVWPVVYATVEAVCADDIIAMVAWEDGRPLAAAMGYLAGEVCEVIHVGAVPPARRRGAGAAVTASVVAEANRRGAALAVLQATTHGEGVYRSLGFEEVDRYRLHLRSVPSR